MTAFATSAQHMLVLPASLAQERLWFVDRLRPGTAAYNIPVLMRLPSAINRMMLERCLLELVRRHEALRTTLTADGGRAVQVISPPWQPELAMVDLRRHPRHEREARLAALMTAESRRPFDLANGPLFRATLYRLAANDHILLLVLHHIISDGWSVEVLMRELGALYTAFDAGLSSPLEPLPIQYADWASWQRDRLEGGVLDEELAFWRRWLDGAPTVLDLPSDRARPEIPSYRGDLEPFAVDDDVAEGLLELAHRHGCTLYMTCLAAFATLLARYAGQLDLLIGTPMTNRTRPELESVVGLFVNTVVLRVDLRGAPSVSELLQRVRALMLEVHAHAEVPLEKLIETLQPERSVGRHPLFQVLFSLNASAIHGAPATPVRVPTPSPPPTTGTSKFDLSLLMTDANVLGGAWEYAADLFDVERIRRMSAHFTRLLRAFVETPDARIDTLPLMGEAEERALVAFERTPRRRHRDECVHERIFAQARHTPDAVAVEGGGETLTYAELVERATRLVGRLRAADVGPDVRVGVFMQRDANLIVAMIAIHAAGGAYVPLDPDHPRERLAHITGDAGLVLAVTTSALAERLPDGVQALLIDSDETADAPAPRDTDPDNLAYVLYTSGTTGHPKGVAVPHRTVSALLDWASTAFTRDEWRRVLASTSISFDISVFEIFLPLTEGGSIVVVENVLALASRGAPDVTLINTVPSAMRELLRLWTPGPSLRTVNLAGEALARDLVDRIVKEAPDVTVWNLYGPTETTVYSTGAQVDPDDRATPSIGRPIAGTSVYVLDAHLARVPIGVPGELYIAGDGVARGYLGRPELTAERYLADPFHGGRMYRTGDVVCWRDDGTLEYRGRGDHQVKLRGHRIELGEIESTLRKHPRVGEAVVIMRRSGAGDAQLIAYTIMDDPDIAELETLARRDLPSYMVPSRFVFVDEMPRTASGKIDRAALPAPAMEDEAPTREAATETEAALRELFAAALERPSFDVDADFFTAGGHSLLATGVVARANELLGVELPLSTIFEHPTPAGLAAYVDSIPARSGGAIKPRRRERGEGPLPLSFAQQGMWFYHRLRPKTALYNLPMVLPTRGAVDHDTLQRAVDHLVARHDALRIRFDTVSGAPVQEVMDEARVNVALHDLTDLLAEERRRRAHRLLERETQRPFDLRRAPLLRVSLLRLSSEESLVVLVMHHIISDGWSTDVLRRDLNAAYEAFSNGTRPALRELPLGYADYVLWQREASRATLDEGIAYFRERLAGAPALLALPTDHPRPQRATFRGGVVAFEIDAQAGSALEEVAAARGATAHMAHLAVFAALLHQLSRQEDVVIGIPVANRSRPEWRDLVGLFTNTLPIRIHSGADPSFAELLERTRDAAIGAYAHEELPFDHLVQELSPARDLAHHPIFQVMLGFQEIEGDGGASPEVLASTGTAKFDLSLSLTRAGHRVLAVLEYATDLFERASMERVARRYRLLAEWLAAEPERAVDEVAPLDDDEYAWREEGSARTLEPEPVASVATEAKQRAPRTDVERKIVGIWAEALEHDRFGIDESFFEVGGHSLAAVCVIARIAEEWGVDIPFEQIFTTPTIEALACAVEGAADAPVAEGPVLQAVERTGPMPLSFAQERLWFLDAMAPGLPVYNISIPVSWRGTVDAGALELALERLGDRHESLRTRFVASPSGGVEQVFDPFMAVDLTVTDLTGLAPAARRAETERVQAREARHAFDLATGPLLRAHVVQLSPAECVLFLTIHHIVADAQSIDILRRDLAALYQSEVTGEPDALPDLPLQFADFAVWQRAWLQGDRLVSEIAHWKRKLAGAPELLALPSDRPRPSELSYAGMQLPFTFGAEVAAGVKRLASEEQATPFMVLFAIYAAVLGRWSGVHDLVVGTPIIGRPKRELEELIGFFSNTLPMRVELGGRRSFRDLVRHVREVVIEAISHERLPFETIVQELQPQRSLAHNPLFQVMFAFQRPGAGDDGAERATGTGSGTSKFDLTLFLVEDDELHGAIEYATDLFEAPTIERLASHLRAAAAAALAEPDAALGELFRASPEDLAAIDEWNATATEYDVKSAHALCASQAARTPNAPAVSSATESWTYEELMRRARGLAASLRAAGVGADSRVAIVADPSLRLISSVLGVWMAGGACVPLDPSYPTTRLAYMAESSGARWLVGSGIADLGMIRVEEGDGDFFADDVSPDHLAYVVFTSGSTGRPKGVAMPHRVLVNLVQWQESKRPGARRTVQFASPSFDVFFQEVLLTIAGGGELVVAGGETRRDPALLVELCRTRRIERLFLPFVALRELAETAGQPPLSDMREVITAGEQLQVTPALRRWFAALPDCRLFNQYGPSETHVVTEEELAADPAEWPALPPIGRPIANARCSVLDGELHPLPIGVPGDLHLGGLTLARGYLGQPEMTAVSFIPEPQTGGRMYRSGDRARWLPDGRIEFLGRGDDQVKIRGYRVEVAEVETALAALPGVSQAVVAALPDANGEKRLVGYVLPAGAALDPASLRERLQDILPEPLVPAIIVIVDELPRTPSGKVDRRALRAPIVEARAVRKPASELEWIVAGIWRDVLSLDQVGADESFFALGGHSLLATRVAARLRERLGADVPVRWIFEHPTVSRLAAALATSVAAPATPDEIPVLPRDGAPLPSSFAQERLWFLDRMEPGNAAYNLTTGIEFPPSLNLDALRRALHELSRRHEALRTVFPEVGGRPMQVVAPAGRVPLEVVDLSYLTAGELEAETRQRGDEERCRSFSLEDGPLFRATLLDLGRKGYLLLLSMHHIISDAWTLRVLHRDLATLYEAFDGGTRPSLPPLRVQYSDFAAWQRERLSGAALDELLTYWRGHLAGAPHRVELPVDRPRTRTQALRGSTLAFELDADVARKLAAIGQEEGATLFMTMSALFLELLRRQTQQEDFLVGTPIGARPRPELEDVVGLFVNTLVLRADLSGELAFRALIRRLREETLSAYSHAELPFERLVEELAPRRDLGANPLIQVAFGLHHGMGADAMSGNGTAKFELSLVMAEADGRLSGIFEYDRDLFEEATIARMAAHFARLAHEVAATPDEPLALLDLLVPSEAREVERWGRGANVPADTDIGDLVARHARRNPSSIAVEAPDGTLTYAELDDAASRLAATLDAVPVGVLLGNSKHLPVVFLAIWRAGGVYVPLDPALPAARLAYLIHDAGVRILYTDAAGAKRCESGTRVILTGSAGDIAPRAAVPIDPEKIAYVIYTSGFTGQPKGVLIPHRGLRVLVAAQLHALGVRATDRVLKFTTQSFDAAIFEITAALSAGATLCLETQDDLLPRPEFVSLLRRRRITMLTIPPSSLAVLPVEELPALRLLFVAGEACPADLVARWARGRRMVNGYGPTETSVWATYADCVADGSKPPIGRPVANARMHIVDRHGRLVPVGVPGELCIGGPLVGLGYLGRPEATAAAFVPDPWGPPGARMYRTGDLVRWRPDGNLDFIGRADGQIKLRGVRIEPSEVEAAIAAFAGVATSAVVARNDVLLAYVVPLLGATIDTAALRRALQDRLPRFLVPSRVVILDELPRTPSGKLDRNALPAPAAETAAEAPEPMTGIEERLSRIWADVLSVPVGPADNFFELGGHSLLVTRVLSRVRDELGLDIPVRRIFEAPTLAAFCEGLELRETTASSSIPRSPRRGERQHNFEEVSHEG